MNKITYEERQPVYEAAIAKWGAEAQAWMVIEEMSELAKELCKARRGKNDPVALADEVADVTIMLEQVRLMFGLNDLVSERMDAKIKRLCARLDLPVKEAWT